MDWRGAVYRPAARWARIGGVAALGAIVATGSLVLVLPFAARAFVRGIVLLASACVWLATSLSTGVSVWTLAGTIWRAAANQLSTPTLSIALWSLVALGALAFYWLQRLLGSEEE
jgi:hypothetical protein